MESACLMDGQVAVCRCACMGELVAQLTDRPDSLPRVTYIPPNGNFRGPAFAGGFGRYIRVSLFLFFDSYGDCDENVVTSNPVSQQDSGSTPQGTASGGCREEPLGVRSPRPQTWLCLVRPAHPA